MVAVSPRSRLVPYHLLVGASCLWPNTTADWRSPAAPARVESADLTPAEQRVCELVLQGLSNKEISSVLGRAEPTIKNQVASVLRKHRVPSRARLIAVFRS